MASAINCIENTTRKKAKGPTIAILLPLYRLLRRTKLVTIFACLLLLHLLLTAMLHIRHFPAVNEAMGYLEEGLPLHIVSAYPRVPVMPNVLVLGERGSGVDVVSEWLVSSGACTSSFPDSNAESTSQTYEPQFFSRPELYQLGSIYYSTLYKHCQSVNGTKTPLILDGSPDTLLESSKVYDVYSSATGGLDKTLKLVVLLREPMSRELYLFNQNKSNNATATSFEEYAIKILKPKALADKRSKRQISHLLSSWTRYFRRSQMLLLSYDELEYNQNRLMWRVEKFLGVKLNRDIVVDEMENVRARRIPPKATEVLETVYWGQNVELYHWVHTNKGGKIEQVPFIEFEYASAQTVVVPNVLLVGAAFSGISLITDLLAHNEACGPSMFTNDTWFMSKEAHFFNKNERYSHGLEFYSRRYQHCHIEGNKNLIFDGTPNYLTFHDRVYETYGQVPSEALAKLKIIIMLRDPIAREKRMYFNKLRDYNKAIDKEHGWFMDILNEKGKVMSFDDYAETALIKHLSGSTLDFASEGKYVDHLRKWFEYFPRHQLLILSHDELMSNPKSLQERVEKFLGIKLEGSLGKMSDDPSVSTRVRAALSPLFDEKNEELYEFLKNHNGPHMEQNPFPRFGSSSATVDDNHR